MKYSDTISGLFWFFVGLWLSIWSLTYEIGRLTEPGPGYLPLALGIILILLSLILLLGQRKRDSRKKQIVSSSPRGSGWKKVAYTVLVMAVAAFFFEKVGYLITFFVLIVLLMKGAEAQSWKRILLTAVLATLGVYIIFVLLLEQPLPRGYLGV
jgi:ABC-type xylose transport system permease subunit